MSKCCICNSRIAPHTATGPLLDSHPDLKLCLTCYNMKQKLNSPNKTDLSTGISYFRHKLKEGVSDPTSIKALKSILGGLDTEKDTGKDKGEKTSAIQEYNERMQNFISTTTDGFEGYKIQKYFGVLSGDLPFKIGSASETDASHGPDMESYNSKLMNAREDALKRLKLKCVKRGANAVVGVTIETILPNSDFAIVIASGTAVTIEQDT